jgi:hypothetical protein
MPCSRACEGVRLPCDGHPDTRSLWLSFLSLPLQARIEEVRVQLEEASVGERSELESELAAREVGIAPHCIALHLNSSHVPHRQGGLGARCLRAGVDMDMGF